MNYEVSREEHSKKYKNLGMRVEYLYCLADFYGVSTDYLLGLTKNPVPDQSIQAVCQYTGLSPSTAEVLHAYSSSGFTTRLIDAILEADGIPTEMPEAITDSAQALVISMRNKLSDNSHIQREVNNRIAVISRNGNHDYHISAEHAADLYLKRAIDIATTNIAAVVHEMRDEIALTIVHSQKTGDISANVELIKVDENETSAE